MQAGADARYQLVFARQFLPLDAEHSASLLPSFEGSGRHVVLVTQDGTTPSSPAFSAVPGSAAHSTAAGGQIAYQRVPGDAAGHLLIVGGRIPGSTAELYVVHGEDRI